MKNIPSGNNPPKEINVFIEIPQGSSVKYELDKKSGAIFVDRFAFTAMFYPFNYGFIPETKADDGDPIDVLVLSSLPVAPGTIIPSRPVAMLEMKDEEGVDTKIIAVPLEKVDPFYAYIKEVGDIPAALKNKIKHFFEHYKELEPDKWVKVKEWRGRGEAEAEIRKALNKIIK